MESAPTGLIDIKILSVGVGAFDDPNVVGDDVLGVPFIKIHYALCGRPLGKPQVFFENIVVAPTDLCDVCCFAHGRFVNRPYGFMNDK